MKIIYHKDFSKAFQNLPIKQQEKVIETIAAFQKNPYDPQLKNHALKGEFLGCRAISAGGDLRLLFRVQGRYERVKFVRVGTHTQVYE